MDIGKKIASGYLNVIRWLHPRPNINDLPTELLVRIFKAFASIVGHWELLKIAKVCRRWDAIVSSPCFWVRVEVHTCTLDNLLFLCRKKWLLRTEHLVLCNIWGGLRARHFPVIFKNCPNLRTLQVENTDLVEKMLIVVAKHCHHIEAVSLWTLEYYPRSSGFHVFMTAVGSNLKRIVLKQILSNNGIHAMSFIAQNCPNLEELSVENSSNLFMIFPITLFQKNCPKIITLCLMNFSFCIDEEKAQSASFPDMRSVSVPFKPRLSGIDDLGFVEMLKGSPNLLDLDIRGTNVTLDGLKKIAATDLRQIMFTGSPLQYTSLDDFLAVAGRWEHSLSRIGDLERDMSVSLRETLSGRWPPA